MPIYIYPLLKSPNLATVLVFTWPLTHFPFYHERPLFIFLSLTDLCDRFFKVTIYHLDTGCMEEHKKMLGSRKLI